MFRRIDAVLAALAVCSLVPVGAASAQARYPYDGGPAVSRGDIPPPASRWYPMPNPSWADEDDDEPVYPRRSPRVVQSQPAPGMPSRITPDIHEADTGNNSGALPPPGLPPAPGPMMGAPQANPDVVRPPATVGSTSPVPPNGKEPPPVSVATLPPEDQPETGPTKELAPNLKKQMVDYQTKEPAGTIIVDTQNTYLYLVLGNGKALRYGVRVGRDGFTWNGTERITRMAEWPDWHPPAEMIERQPYLPRFTAGGAGNPLGARAMYLGKTVYRIHGTNQPSTIGKFVSSGCVGMLNEDVEDLYSRVQVGTRVVVIPGEKPATTASNVPPNSPAQPVAPTPASIPAPISNSAITSSPLPPPTKR